jgi:hypothetical protein
LLTLTGRFPFGRFAPYITGGLGFIDGGATLYKFFNEKHTYASGAALGAPINSPQADGSFVNNEREYWTVDPVYNNHIRALGQIGAGLEFRITCHIGLMADVTWNFVFGPDDHVDKFSLVNEQGFDQITAGGGVGVLSTTPNINTALELRPGHSSDHQDFGMARFGVTFSY